MDVNLKSMLLVTRCALPSLKASHNSSIMNVASLAGYAGSLVYSTAKGAVLIWTKSLAKELGPEGIRVNAIAPGFILGTAFHATYTTTKSANQTVTGFPLGRADTSADVFRLVASLASEYDGFISGATLDINGGMYGSRDLAGRKCPYRPQKQRLNTKLDLITAAFLRHLHGITLPIEDRYAGDYCLKEQLPRPIQLNRKLSPIMNNTLTPLPELLAKELGMLQKHWRWFFAMGVAMIVLGMIAVSWASVAKVTVAATWLFGFFLLAGGIAQIISSFWVGRWSGMLLHLLIGVLYSLVGFVVIDQPIDAAIELTLLIAIFLMVGGIFRVVFAVSERFAGSGWVLLNGVVTFVLGLLIYKQWPASGLWVIGLFVGIELIFNGISWVMLSLGLRNHSPIKEVTAD